MRVLKFIMLFLTVMTFAQTSFSITGHLGQAADKQILLKRYDLGQEIKLDENKTDSKGNFSLQYPADYVGAAILEITNEKKVIVLLNHENFEIQWDDLNNISTLRFVNSNENSAFDKGLQLYQVTQEKKAGIQYLLPYYSDEPQKKQFFTNEMAQLTSSLPDYLNQLPVGSYVSYYLNIRILIANLQLTAERRFSNIAELENQFNNLDFNDVRLLHSGLYNELLSTYFIALENYGDKAPGHINASIDAVLAKLKTELKQDTAEYLFNLLEKRSLYDSAGHLAVSMLNAENCKLDDRHKALFEQYRKMATGNTAPDIDLSGSNSTVKKLSQLKNKYKLVVFGASWCPKCAEEIPKFKAFYSLWKKMYNVEIVFISLDTQKTEFTEFTKTFPWLSICDFKGWETKAATDYCIFATPTMYLLDTANTIKLKPISAEQIETWLKIHK